MSQTKRTIPKIVNERLYVKDGSIVNHDQTFRADIYVENGVIRQLGSDLTVPGGATVVDAKGALILPGGVDPSVRFSSSPLLDDDANCDDVTTVDDFYSGSRAALLGGTTTVFDFVTARKGGLMTAHKERLEASSTSCCDVSLHVDVTSWNDETKKSLTMLANEHGINSFCVAMSDRFQLNDEQLYDVMEHVKSLGGVIIVKAENGDLVRKLSGKLKSSGLTQPEGILQARNEDVEAEAVNKAITIAKLAVCPIYFYSITSQKSIDLINEARKSGQPVYGQVHAVSLFRDGSSYRQPSWNKAASCVTWPPLRDDSRAQQRLLEALSSGNLQCVSSGHSVYTNADKNKLGRSDFAKIPPGTNGVYERMMTLWSTGVESGLIDKNQFVAITSTNAARIFNIFPRKGYVGIGSDADLVIWREDQCRSVASAASAFGVTKPDCINSLEGAESNGSPSVVICRGKIVFQDDEVHVVQAHGNLVARSLKSPLIYNRLMAREKALREQGVGSVRITTPQAIAIGNGPRMREHKSKQHTERYTRNSGHRAMHQSGWSFSGEQVDDDMPQKTSVRYSNPPGGSSHFNLY